MIHESGQLENLIPTRSTPEILRCSTVYKKLEIHLSGGKRTASLPLRNGGWKTKTIAFPIGFRSLFRGELLNFGRVIHLDTKMVGSFIVPSFRCWCNLQPSSIKIQAMDQKKHVMSHE